MLAFHLPLRLRNCFNLRRHFLFVLTIGALATAAEPASELPSPLSANAQKNPSEHRQSLVSVHTLASWDTPALAWQLERAPEIKQISGRSMPPESPTFVAVYPDQGRWTAEKSTSQCTEESGVLHFVPDGQDSITTPYGFSAYSPSIGAIELEMCVKNASRVWFSWLPGSAYWDWSDTDGHCRIPLPVRRQGERDTWRIATDNLPEWRGRATQGLRIIVPEGGELTLHRVRLERDRDVFRDAPWGVCTFRIKRDLRPAIFTWAPLELSFPIPACLIGNDQIHFSVDLARIALDSSARTTLEAALDDGVTRRTFYTTTLEAGNPWLNQDLPLPSPSADDRLILSVSAEVGEDPLTLWGNPQLYLPREASFVPPEKSPNILLYVVDSLRADHLSTYGYERDTSPFLTSLASRGVTFERFLAQDTCTRASMATLTTGVDTLVHGIHCLGTDQPKGFTLFPTLLREQGYATAVISENLYTPPTVFNQVPFNRLVDVNEDKAAFEGTTRSRAAQFFAEHAARPFFLYVHTMEAHIRMGGSSYCYRPSEEFLGRWDQRDRYPEIDLQDEATWENASNEFHRDRYDEAIAFGDENFRRVVEELEAQGLGENTLIIFTSDHGQGFGSHDGRIVHGYEPYEELIHVPLVMAWPGHFNDGRVLDVPVTMRDIAPTLLDLTGSQPLIQGTGLSLVRYLRGQETPATRALPAYQGFIAGLLTSPALSEGTWKVLLPLTQPAQAALFDIAADPDETINLRDAQPALFQRLSTQLRGHMREQLHQRIDQGITNQPENSEVFDPERAERLSTLGYLE